MIGIGRPAIEQRLARVGAPIPAVRRRALRGRTDPERFDPGVPPAVRRRPVGPAVEELGASVGHAR